LTNHLGNVLVTISDKKIGVSTNGTTIDYYNADVVTANDYYPFGSQMPGRKYSASSSSYRYGFNGKELDKETTGTTTYDYGFRIYSPALGRFLSTDPLYKEYPFFTPYQYASNCPIVLIDIDGLEGIMPSIFRTGPILTLNNAAAVAQEYGVLKQQHPNWGKARLVATASLNASMGKIHFALDVAGMAPVVGEVADVVNGGFYLIQGDKTNAALSAASAIPFVGWGATGAKWMGKAMKFADGTSGFLQMTKNAKGVVEFGSGSQLRGVIGLVDKGMEAHHIVPWALRENTVIQKAADAGFHMNDKLNGMGLKKYSKELLEGVHGNHPAYNDFVEGQLTKFAEKMGDKLTPKAAKDYLQNTLIPTLKNKIKAVEKAGGNLNDAFKN